MIWREVELEKSRAAVDDDEKTFLTVTPRDLVPLIPTDEKSRACWVIDCVDFDRTNDKFLPDVCRAYEHDATLVFGEAEGRHLVENDSLADCVRNVFDEKEVVRDWKGQHGI